jgi:hypothetical protein
MSLPLKPFRNYVVMYVLTAFITSLPMIANLLFLKHAHEIDPMMDIVRYQTKTQGVYGAALVDNTFRYKLALIRLKKPEIVALGSSRTMPFQDDSFTTSFVNAGGGMHHLNEGLLFLQQMFVFHTPKILMIGVDYAWFNAAHPEPYDYPQHDYNEADITRSKLTTPFVWLGNHKISFRRYVQTVLGWNLKNPYTNFTNIGFMAIERSDGFRPDGSRFYGNRYTGNDQNFDDIRFANTLDHLRQRCCEFEPGTGIDPIRLDELQKIVALCDQHHVQTMLFLTPMAPTIYLQMRQSPEDFGYADDLQNVLQKMFNDKNHEFYDFRDLARIGSNNCECVDGAHGGNVAYDRILGWIAQHRTHSMLNGYLNLEVIDARIKQFGGDTLALPDVHQINFKEADFLQLGCKKQ